MVQAAAQAQAVVAAGKQRGNGLGPMDSTEIAALSRIQAQAIVNVRPSTALIASGKGTDQNLKPTQEQIESHIQLQTQALIHAHTQAQIAAGVYKGEGPSSDVSKNGQSLPIPKAAKKQKLNPKLATASTNSTSLTTSTSLTSSQMQQQNELTSRQQSLRNDLLKTQRSQMADVRNNFQKTNSLQANPDVQSQMNQIQELQKKHAQDQREQQLMFQKEMQDLQALFRKQNSAAKHAGVTSNQSASFSGTQAADGVMMPAPPVLPNVNEPRRQRNTSTNVAGVMPSESSTDTPGFKCALAESLSKFWSKQMDDMIKLPIGDEQDFKNHNDLPLARIKRIMKSDEDVRMISAEAPVLFAKACEMFILELTLRSWAYSESNKRRTLQKEDIQMAIQRTDIFDFLVDVIH